MFAFMKFVMVPLNFSFSGFKFYFNFYSFGSYVSSVCYFSIFNPAVLLKDERSLYV